MKTLFRHPLVLRHIPNGFQSYRYLACTKTLEIDVSEATAAEAPIVIEWTPDGKGVGSASRQYRLVEDSLFAPLAQSRPRVCRLDDDFPASPLVAEVKNEITSVILEKGHTFAFPAPNTTVPSKWPSVDGGLPSKVSMEDVFLWEDKMRSLASTFFWIEGRLWKACPEPLVCVHRNSFGWHASLTHEASMGADPMRFHYAVDRWDDATAAVRSLALDTGKALSTSSLYYDPSFTLSSQAETADIRLLGEFVIEAVSSAMFDKSMSVSRFGSVRPKLQWKDVPVQVFEGYSRLRSATEHGGSGDEIAEALEFLHGFAGESRMTWLLPMQAVAAHLEKWHSRPVEVALTDAARRSSP